jgi:hypothetical protein
MPPSSFDLPKAPGTTVAAAGADVFAPPVGGDPYEGETHSTSCVTRVRESWITSIIEEKREIGDTYMGNGVHSHRAGTLHLDKLNPPPIRPKNNVEVCHDFRV